MQNATALYKSMRCLTCVPYTNYYHLGRMSLTNQAMRGRLRLLVKHEVQRRERAEGRERRQITLRVDRTGHMKHQRGPTQQKQKMTSVSCCIAKTKQPCNSE